MLRSIAQLQVSEYYLSWAQSSYLRGNPPKLYSTFVQLESFPPGAPVQETSNNDALMDSPEHEQHANRPRPTQPHRPENWQFILGKPFQEIEEMLSSGLGPAFKISIDLWPLRRATYN